MAQEKPDLMILVFQFVYQNKYCLKKPSKNKHICNPKVNASSVVNPHDKIRIPLKFVQITSGFLLGIFGFKGI